MNALKIIIRVSLFVVLCLLVLWIYRAQSVLTSHLQGELLFLKSRVEQKYNIHLEIGSIRPAFLTSIRIKHITLWYVPPAKDDFLEEDGPQQKEVVASINDIDLRCDILQAIKSPSVQSILKSVTIGRVALTPSTNFIAHVTELAKEVVPNSLQDDFLGTKMTYDALSSFVDKAIKKDAPSLHFVMSMMVDTRVKSMEVDVPVPGVNLSIKGNAALTTSENILHPEVKINVTTSPLPKISNPAMATVIFAADIPKIKDTTGNLDGSQGVVTLQEWGTPAIKGPRVDVLLRYARNKLTADTIRHSTGLKLHSQVDFKTGAINAEVQAKDLQLKYNPPANASAQLKKVVQYANSAHLDTVTKFSLVQNTVTYSSKGSLRSDLFSYKNVSLSPSSLLGQEGDNKVTWSLGKTPSSPHVGSFLIDTAVCNSSVEYIVDKKGVDVQAFVYDAKLGPLEISTAASVTGNLKSGFHLDIPTILNVQDGSPIAQISGDFVPTLDNKRFDFFVDIDREGISQVGDNHVGVTGNYKMETNQLKGDFQIDIADIGWGVLPSLAAASVVQPSDDLYAASSNLAGGGDLYPQSDTFGQQKSNPFIERVSVKSGGNFAFGFGGGTPTYDVGVSYLALLDKQDSKHGLFSTFNINNKLLEISQFQIILGKLTVDTIGLVEQGQESAYFTLDSLVKVAGNSSIDIPYHFTGNASRNDITLTGDYGLAMSLHNSGGPLGSGKEQLDGSFYMESLPIKAGLMTLYTTMDAGFSYSKEESINVSIPKIEVRGTGGKYPFSPHFLASKVTATKYGLFTESMHYDDIFSKLEGTSALIWNMNEGNFESMQFQFMANDTNEKKTSSNKENFTVSIEASNPFAVPINLSNIAQVILHSLYFNMQIALENFELNRFTNVSLGTSAKNSITGSIIASGALDNPYVGINIDEFSFTNADMQLQAGLNAYLEQKVLTVDNSFVRVGHLGVTNVNAQLDLTTLMGNASCDIDTYFMQRTLHVPLELSITNVYRAPNKLIPEEATVVLKGPDVRGTFIKKPFPFMITALHTPGNTTIFSNPEIGLMANISDTGSISASIDKSKPLSFNAFGNISSKVLDFQINDIVADLGPLWTYMNFPYVNIFKAKATGNIAIGGLIKDPDITGKINAKGIDLNVPIVVPYHVTIKEANALFLHNIIHVPEVSAFIKGNNPAFAKADVYLGGGKLDHVEAALWTPQNKFVPLDLTLDVARFAGEASAYVNLYYADKYLDITGNIKAKKAKGIVTVGQVAGLPAAQLKRKKKKMTQIERDALKLPFFIRCDMGISLLNNCSFQLEPILRAVMQPNGTLAFKYDGEAEDFSLDGNIGIKTGDISYLNRNFYLKSGSVKFSPQDIGVDPSINVEATTRERDAEGGDIQLTLVARNQHLSDLHPQITSIPAKSETEIAQILGQMAIADATDVSSFLVATGDYALQSTMGRIIENKTRDFLHLDILSMRTNILQNTLRINTGMGEESNANERNFHDRDNLSQTVGNYLDNTTLYFGKYMGSTVYLDALMNWKYDGTQNRDNDNVFSGLIFKPNFGIELDSPFGNIRYDLAPDITSFINGRFNMDAKITLSWRWAL